jgi:hypothetical protein
MGEEERSFEIRTPLTQCDIPKTTLPKPFGDSQPRASLPNIRRMIVADTNASALARGLS